MYEGKNKSSKSRFSLVIFSTFRVSFKSGHVDFFHHWEISDYVAESLVVFKLDVLWSLFFFINFDYLILIGNRLAFFVLRSSSSSAWICLLCFCEAIARVHVDLAVDIFFIQLRFISASVVSFFINILWIIPFPCLLDEENVIRGPTGHREPFVDANKKMSKRREHKKTRTSISLLVH